MQEGFLNLCQKKTIFGMVKILTKNLFIGLILSKLIEILYFFFEKYPKLNEEHEFDAKNIIKC